MRIVKYTTELGENGDAVLVKETSQNYSHANYLNSPESIYKFCCYFLRMDKKTEEHVYILCFNAKYRMIGFFEISHGTYDKSIAEPRDILRNALLLNAVSVILVHNHPSGDATPSDEDNTLYKRVKSAGEIVGIKIPDSMIIGSNQYYSFAEQDK